MAKKICRMIQDPASAQVPFLWISHRCEQVRSTNARTVVKSTHLFVGIAARKPVMMAMTMMDVKLLAHIVGNRVYSAANQAEAAAVAASQRRPWELA